MDIWTDRLIDEHMDEQDLYCLEYFVCGIQKTHSLKNQSDILSFSVGICLFIAVLRFL